ncbi:MAG: 4-hydroxy-tetrahydrodipicolinate reductase [Treponema sp.]|nr:4-hydroxy-tetrahydrodipicolinate reductase [Treponema sp.]
MKALIVGYGRMGRLIEERLLQGGHQVPLIIEPVLKGSPSSGAQVFPSLEEARKAGALKDLDLAIEFSLPSQSADNLILLAQEKIPAVCGTTGWYDRLDEVKAAVEAASCSLVWASNFSLGVNLFFRIASFAAKLMDPFAEYDVGGFEAHHNNKADSPSGTAKVLVQGVLKEMTRKKRGVYEMLDRKPEADELHYASLRVGSVFGDHSLIFDSPADSIEISHRARNRDGLVSGAVLAAQWLVAEKRTGTFTVDDVLEDIL